MTKKYTHIFFDLDNTLWDFEKNSEKAMFETFHQFKLADSLDFKLFFEIYSKHNHALWAGYRSNTVNKHELTRLRFQNTFLELEIQDIDAVEMNNLYLNEMPKQKELNEGTIEILNYLKKKRYLLNIITNGFKEVQYKKIESSGLKPFFDKIFISEEVKAQKPKHEIFEYAIKSTNAKKKCSIMIGDDWNVDVMGAVNFGIDAVHYSNSSDKTCNNYVSPRQTKCEIFTIEMLNQLQIIL